LRSTCAPLSIKTLAKQDRTNLRQR